MHLDALSCCNMFKLCIYNSFIVSHFNKFLFNYLSNYQSRRCWLLGILGLSRYVTSDSTKIVTSLREENLCGPQFLSFHTGFFVRKEEEIRKPKSWFKFTTFQLLTLSNFLSAFDFEQFSGS